MSEQPDARVDSPRVVIDTNQLLLGMFNRGLALPLIQAWIRGEFAVIVSAELLDELVEVIARPKFTKRITKKDAEKLLELIYRKADNVVVTTNPILGRDADDYPVLGAAIAGNATHIVTNDKDLLDDPTLRSEMKRSGVDIMATGEFLRFLKTRAPRH